MSEMPSGAPVPPVLAAFWRTVGSVHLVPHHDSGRLGGIPDGLIMLDPLEVEDPAATWFAVEEWQDEASGIHPDRRADRIVREEVHQLTFTDYLRRAFTQKGFPRLPDVSGDREAAEWIAGVVVNLVQFRRRNSSKLRRRVGRACGRELQQPHACCRRPYRAIDGCPERTLAC